MQLTLVDLDRDRLVQPARHHVALAEFKALLEFGAELLQPRPQRKTLRHYIVAAADGHDVFNNGIHALGVLQHDVGQAPILTGQIGRFR